MKNNTTTGAGNFSAAHEAYMTDHQLHIMRWAASREDAESRREELLNECRIKLAGRGYVPKWIIEEMAAINLYIKHA